MYKGGCIGVVFCSAYFKCKPYKVVKTGLIFLRPFTCSFVVSVRRSFLFLLVVMIGCIILFSDSLCLP